MQRALRAGLTGTAVAATILALAACAPAADVDDGPSSITIAIPSTQFATNFDPANGGFLWFLPTRPVYDALLIWDDDAGDYAPWLAQEFEISDDGMTLTLTLREDVDFVDGEHLNAAGVEKVLDAAFTNPASYFSYVPGSTGAEATATGEYTLEITTTKPIYLGGTLLSELTYLPISSPAGIDDPSLLAEEPIGSGPYVIDEIVPDVSVSYVRNPDYWNPDAFDFDTVKIVSFEDKVAALNALKSGQIDAAEMDYGLAQEAEESGLTLHLGPGGFAGLFILDRKGEIIPALGDVRVRQAMNMAFDREAIAETTELGFGHVSSQPFGKGSLEYVEGGDDRYPYDLEAARELMAEAGYADGFTIQIPGGFPLWAAIDYQPIIEQSLADINITVEWITVADYAAAYAKMEAMEVPVGLAYQIFSNTIDAFEVRGGWTTQPVDDPEFTAMMELYTYGTPAERAEVQPKLAEYILEEAWYVPFSQAQTVWASTPGVDVKLPVPYTFPSLLAFTKAD